LRNKIFKGPRKELNVYLIFELIRGGFIFIVKSNKSWKKSAFMPLTMPEVKKDPLLAFFVDE